MIRLSSEWLWLRGVCVGVCVFCLSPVSHSWVGGSSLGVSLLRILGPWLPLFQLKRWWFHTRSELRTDGSSGKCKFPYILYYRKWYSLFFSLFFEIGYNQQCTSLKIKPRIKEEWRSRKNLISLWRQSLAM